jgi:hypothetical protein
MFFANNQEVNAQDKTISQQYLHFTLHKNLLLGEVNYF